MLYLLAKKPKLDSYANVMEENPLSSKLDPNPAKRVEFLISN